MKEKIEGFITAVQRERYEVQINGESCYARLKAGIYYSGEAKEDFPTVLVKEWNS